VPDSDAVMEALISETDTELTVTAVLGSGSEADTVAPTSTEAAETLTQTAIAFGPTVHPAGGGMLGLTDVV
jgi:hypothetical protein